MVQDLRTDVSNIQILLTHFDEKVLRYDTLDHFLTEFLKGSSLPFERNFSAFTYYRDYSPVERTISQLKNSGALRLIRLFSPAHCKRRGHSIKYAFQA
jgi:hypothetical protein